VFPVGYGQIYRVELRFKIKDKTIDNLRSLSLLSINGVCGEISCSKYLSFADGMKIYREIKYPEDWHLLQSNSNSVQI
jgi:hypothetical protein